MFLWVPIAMVRVTTALICGILTAMFYPQVSFHMTVMALLVLYLVKVGLHYFRASNHAAGWIGLALVFTSGYLLFQIRNEADDTSHLLNQARQPIIAYKAAVAGYPDERAASYRVLLNVYAIKTTTWQPATGKVLVNIKTDTLRWNDGDQLLIRGTPRRIRSSGNPGAFDYAAYLSRRQIFYQQYVQVSAVKKISDPAIKGVRYYAFKARRWVAEQIATYIPEGQERAIIQAISIGIKGGIDNEMRQAFAASGAMHVLAVSGLHVGILYTLLLFLLKPFSRLKYYRVLEVVVSMGVLWMFAFTSGMLPPVLRATMMFSFFAIARLTKGGANPYNILAGSAFILLLYDPQLILNVGFQLSYTAVAGIIYGYKRLTNLASFNNRVLHYVWQVTCLSVSAQLATTLLSLYYFGQFPVYFALSNLIVVPLISFILSATGVLLAVSFLPPVAEIVGQVTYWLTAALVEVVVTIEQLPFSVIDQIRITPKGVALLAIALLAAIMLIEKRRIAWLFVCGAAVVLFSANRWWYYAREVSHDQFVVYNLKKRRAIEWSAGAWAITADTLASQPNHVKRGIKHVVLWGDAGYPVEDLKGLSFFTWKGRHIGLLYKKQDEGVPWPYLDVLVISHHALRKLEKLVDNNVPMVVLDATNSTRYPEKMANFCLSKNIPLHSVPDSGAFILNQ